MPKLKQSTPEYITRLDELPARTRTLQRIERAAAHVADFYGFDELRPAVVDDPHAYAALIKSGFLDGRPPVVVKTRAGEEVMLRLPAALAALRVYTTHRMQDLPHPLKLAARGESFSLGVVSGGADVRRAGMRIDQEWGLVMIGEESSVGEAETIQIIWRILQELAIGESEQSAVRMNAVGCMRCRSSFRSALSSYLRPRKNRLCASSRREMKKTPSLVLACSDEKCRMVTHGAPQALDFLCDACKSHIKGLFEFLDEAEIPYILDNRLFREGLWFDTVIFEFTVRRPAGRAAGEESASGLLTSGGYAREISEVSAPVPEADDADSGAARLCIAQGGRVSVAAGLIGGKEIHAVAGTLSLGALARFLEEREALLSLPGAEEVFLVQLGDLAKRKSFSVLETLREGGIAVKESLGRDSIKSQLKIAERIGAKFALIIGQKEALDDTIIVREVESGIQETVPQGKLVEFLKRKLKK